VKKRKLKQAKKRLAVFDKWEQRAWEPVPEIMVDEWSEQNLVLPRLLAEMSGPLSWDVAPFAREILQAATDPDVEEITLCFSAQTCKTLICMSIILYFLAKDPWPCLHVMAREDDAVALNETRYQAIIRGSPNLATLLTGAAHDMTREAIRLNDTMLTFVGANSPAALAFRSIAKLVLDETDKYHEFTGKEADPIALARERTTTYTSRLILKLSTPTTERGYIWQEYLQGDRRRFFVPCPHCGYFQRLVMGTAEPGCPGIKIPAGERDPERIVDRKLAWYECEGCRGRINDAHKSGMLRAGKWVPEAQELDPRTGEINGIPPPRRRLSYHLSRLYAPWSNTTFSHVIAEFLRSKDIPRLLMNFRNSWLAEVWHDKVDEVKDEHLRSRVGAYKVATVPAEAHLLTAGVDVQLDHLWYVVRAWGPHGESWLVRAGRLGDFGALETALFRARYGTPGTRETVPLKLVLIDVGFAGRKDEVLAFCRRNHCQAVRGDANPTRSVTTTTQTDSAGRSSGLVLLDTGYFKSKLHRQIRIGLGDPGAWHLPEGLDEEYFRHLVAEQRILVTDKKTGRTHYVWRVFPQGAANHLFDCEVYALAAAELLDVEYALVAKTGSSAPSTHSDPSPPAAEGEPELVPQRPRTPAKTRRFTRTLCRTFSN